MILHLLALKLIFNVLGQVFSDFRLAWNFFSTVVLTTIWHIKASLAKRLTEQSIWLGWEDISIQSFFSSASLPTPHMYIGADFVSVKSGFLQFLLTQTSVKCTSLDSSRCVVYFGTRFETIWTASKNLEQDEWWKVGSDYVTFTFFQVTYIIIINLFFKYLFVL